MEYDMKCTCTSCFGLFVSSPIISVIVVGSVEVMATVSKAPRQFVN